MILEQIYSKIKRLDFSYWLILVFAISAAIYGYGFSAALLTVLIFGTSFLLVDFIFWIPDFLKRPQINYKALVIPCIVIILDAFLMNEWGLKMTGGLTIVWILIILLLRLIK
jgi:hypothetical protein